MKEKYLEVQGKSFAALASNDLAKETLKDSYGIIHQILDLLMTIYDDHYLSILSPLLYYFVEHRSVADYMLSTYKQLKEKFVSFNRKLNKVYKQKCEEMAITDDEVEELLKENSFISDKLLFGFIPLMPYFAKQRTYYKKKPIPTEKQFIARVKDIMNMLDLLGCKPSEKSEKKAVINSENIDP